MRRTVIESGLWVIAGLVLWLAPPSWKPLGYVVIGVAVIVAVSSYVDSRRRVEKAKEDVDTAKRELDELRKKSE